MTRLGFVHRGIVTDRSGLLGPTVWALCAIAIPTLIRLAASPIVDDLPYLTYFPAVLLATMFMGWRWGLVVVVGCAISADYFFIRPLFGFSFAAQSGVGATLFLTSAMFIVVAAQTLRASVREVDANTRRERVLSLELQHRVKNNLSVVQGIARQTARTTPDPTEFYKAFDGRLAALSQANEILITGSWEECRLPDLVRAALAPFARDGAVEITGPECSVPAATCVPLVLALHELATNAVKYGALSRSAGKVILTWRLEEGSADLDWVEVGGPLVAAPNRKGLGSRLLTEQAGLFDVQLDFRPDGLICRIKLQKVTV